MFKLQSVGLNGKLYFAIKALYSSTFNSVKVNKYMTERFESKYGVRQGDCLSPTLFSIYINDLVVELNSLQIGVRLMVKTFVVYFMLMIWF